MRVAAIPSQITVWAPAKINLFLEVLRRRADGYHELESFMAPVGLFDTLVCRSTNTGRVELQVTHAAGSRRHSDAELAKAGDRDAMPDLIPADQRNLVVQAVQRVKTALGVTAGMSMQLHKRIPSQAGLGGGSSDAAAALVAAQRLWALDLSPRELQHLATQIGSDVPFFLAGGPAVCRGRGELVQPLQARRRVPIVIVKPPIGLETAAVYKNCEISQHPVSLPFPDSRSMFRVLLFNRLQFAAEALYPRMIEIKNRFAACGVEAHQMTGSGSAYFGMLRHARDALRVAQLIRQSNLGQVYLTHCMM